MKRHVKKDISFYKNKGFDMFKSYLGRRTNAGKYSVLTVFDISEFQNESDIPEKITEVYEHDTLMIIGNPDNEKKTPEKQHAILKRLYKALKNQIISELRVSKLYTYEDPIINNTNAYAALDDRKNTRNRSLQELKFEHTSFQTAQWANIYFSYRSLKSLRIKTEKEEMLNIRDYAGISHLDFLRIEYIPDSSIPKGEIAEIRRRPIRLSIKTFVLDSDVPIGFPVGMLEPVKDTILIPYIVFKGIDFRKTKPNNAKCLFLTGVAPFSNFLDFIGNTSGNPAQATKLKKLKEIIIFADLANRRTKINASQQDITKILQWGASLNRGVQSVSIANVILPPEQIMDLRANPEKITSITPGMKRLNIDLDIFTFVSQKPPNSSTRSPRNR